MSCQIILAGESYTRKRLDFGQVESLTGLFEDLAYGSVNIRLNARSLHRGRRNPLIEQAARVYLLGFDGQNLTFHIESDPLGPCIEGLQGDLFAPEQAEELAQQTGLGLAVQSVQASIDPQADRTWLDKSLLERMGLFSKLLHTPEDRISILNQGSFAPLELTQLEVQHMARLHKEAPPSRRILVSGLVDVSARTAQRIDLMAGTQRVRVFIKEPPEEMGIQTGQQLTVSGMANYRADGSLLNVEADKVRPARKGDKAFERVNRSETQREQLERLRREKPQHVNPLLAMRGKWPGDETFEEIIAQLD